MTHRPHTAPVLMMVHAHPDDESSLTGGTLARYAAAGMHTILVTCTDGRQGDDGTDIPAGSPAHDPHAVAARRSAELDRASRRLGVSEVIELGYPDSGAGGGDRAGGDPNSFSQLPLRPMLERLVRVIRMHHPRVIVTYPPNGLSGHPDHIRVHELVSAAHRNITANQSPTPGRDVSASVPWNPTLFHIAMSRTRMRALHDLAVQSGLGQIWAPPQDMAISDERVTTTIDIEPYWTQKLHALAAHRSQTDAVGLHRLLATADPTGQVEQYVQVHPARSNTHPQQQDLFAPSTP